MFRVSRVMKFMFNKKRQHRKAEARSGFVLIEALVAVAMLGFAALGEE
jgi:type II secretory pathway pseudopilin PulG